MQIRLGKTDLKHFGKNFFIHLEYGLFKRGENNIHIINPGNKNLGHSSV